MSKKTTIELGKLKTIYNVCSRYANAKTKFGYACLKNKKIIEDATASFDSELDDKRTELASVDEKGNLIISQTGAYSYTKEKEREFKKFITEHNQKQVTFEPYIATDFSSVADDPQLLDLLNGVVVDVDIEQIYAGS